jgi:hypothetical protein
LDKLWEEGLNFTFPIFGGQGKIKKMEDLLYVLAILAWVIYSFYKNAKKVKKQRPATRQPIESLEDQSDDRGKRALPGTDEYKSILRELFGEDVIPDDKPAPSPPQREEPIPEPVWVQGDMMREREALAREEAAKEGYQTWDDAYEESGMMPSGMVIEQEEIEREIQADVRRAMEEEKKLRKGFQFDLRQAVIMSEILKRPYDETRSERTF